MFLLCPIYCSSYVTINKEDKTQPSVTRNTFLKMSKIIGDCNMCYEGNHQAILNIQCVLERQEGYKWDDEQEPTL